MAGLKIRLLGGLEIEGSGGKPLTRKAKAVAAYLALQQGQPQSRERIAALFWENSPEEQARTNLRQCLSTLRKHFGDALIADAGSVRLHTSAIDTDVERFGELIASDNQDALAEAIDLYGGDVLDGFGLKEEAFEAWLRPERERYRAMMTDGLLKLIDHYEALKDVGSTVKWATRLLALDPLNETVHRALMRAYTAQDRYDAALRQFETCRDVLLRELSVEPQAETSELARRVKAQRKIGASSTSETAPIPDLAKDLTRLGIDFSLPPKPSIILMPFKDLSADGELGHLAEGIRIDVQCALVKISGLFVIAIGSAAIYADRSVSPGQVCNEMGVRHVLEATLRGNSRQIRLTAQLTDGTTGQVIWSDHYDRSLDGNFLVQDEIADEIVTSLDVTLVRGEQARVWRKTLRDPKALELYYKGLEILSTFDKPSVAEARQLFERVNDISPSVTLGPTLVAFCHYWDATMGWSDNAPDALDEAGKWAARAAMMEDADGQAHAILAHVKLVRGEHDQALEIAREAIRLRPLCATTNALSANVLLYCGLPENAVERVKSAIRYSPVYAAWWVEILASAYRDAGQNDLAIAAANELLRKNHDNLSALLLLSTALVASDDLSAARGCAARILQLDPQFSLSRYAKQHPYQNTERLAELLANLRRAGLPD